MGRSQSVVLGGAGRCFAAGIIACLAVSIVWPAQLPAADQAAVSKLVLSNKILAMEGLVGPFGHVSVRSTRPGRFLIAKHESADRVTAADIIEVEEQVTPALARERDLYLEVFIHSTIYAQYPDIKAVVHTHAPSATALGTLRTPNNRILPTTNPGANLGNFIPIFPEVGLVRDPDKGRRIAASLQGQNGVLLRGHGAVVVGNSLEQAVLRAIYLEFEARAQMLSRGAGEPLPYTSEESDLFKETRAIDHAWHYFEEKAGRYEDERRPQGGQSRARK